MSANPCIKCGGAVRLRAYLTSVGRARGVAHYYEHKADVPCDATRLFSCVMVKPYPPEGKRPYDAMQTQWNAQNPVALATPTPPDSTPVTTAQSPADSGRMSDQKPEAW